MKKVLFVFVVALLFVAGCSGGKEESAAPKEEKPQEELKQEQPEQTADLEEGEEASEIEEEEQEKDFVTEAEANAEAYPAKPGAMLYDKTEEKFKGMNYHFKGELVKVEKVEGLFGNMEDAFLVKNENGYIMPIFPPYEMSASAGDEIEVWGPLSGDGYASSDLGVDNVVGVAGAMNATRVDINGEMQ
ncbi:hypothetical protein BLX87_23090 [Bacillus sp. VT-16-64]|nr:hypothetical protein BLX87_23090 [Bacillus sp. VT-16-64]